ncbi:MAG: glutathione S-transferase [Myxococcota bacterium]|nr:glutathione S-transferase [Myxococcota bacterium]
MITVHHLNASRSTRIVWLLEELGLEYEIELHERDPATQRAPESLRKVHPLGKSPVVQDGDLVLVESGAIVEYLCRCRARGRLVPPESSPDFARYLQWMHFAEGSAVLPLLLDLLLGMVPAAAESFLAGYVEDEIEKVLGYMDDELAGRPWFSGEAFSAADLMMTFVVEFASMRGKLEGRANLHAFLERVHARPAYQRAAEVAP